MLAREEIIARQLAACWVQTGDYLTQARLLQNQADYVVGNPPYIRLEHLAKGGEAAVVESVKAASEVYAPIAGEVVEVNSALTDEPGKVNESPEGDGWFLKLKPSNPSDVEGLMDETAYQAFLETI